VLDSAMKVAYVDQRVNNFTSRNGLVHHHESSSEVNMGLTRTRIKSKSNKIFVFLADQSAVAAGMTLVNRILI
jgi:hypothetical protein